MQFEDAKNEIKRNWQRLYPADNSGKGIICPLCGNGTGADGDGIVLNKKGQPYSLKCFKCDFSGDVIALKMANDASNFMTAFNALAEQLGITVDNDQPNNWRENSEGTKQEPATQHKHEKQEVQEKQEAQAAALVNYTNYYTKQRRALIDSKEALLYLTSRGISEETAAFYYLGYDAQWISPTTIRNLEAAGNSWRPAASKRIIMPINASCYVARAIDPTTEKKYCKMNECGGGNVDIFNYACLNTAKTVFITEGIFDALSVIEVGQSAISLNSTSNAELLLKRLEEKPTKATLILCLDNDDSGRKATELLANGLKKLNISYLTADICEGCKDPNEALTYNREQFAAAVKAAADRASRKPDTVGNYIDLFMQEDINELKAAGEIKTNLSNLDALSGGIYAGLYVIAAISSLGKTTFAHQIADGLAAAGKDVLFFSLEQSRLELVSKSIARITAQQCGHDKAVNSLAIRKGYTSQAVEYAMQIYKQQAGDKLSIIEGNFNCNISFISEYIKNYIRLNEVKPVVFIDYLQILQSDQQGNRAPSTRETVETTITELKRISREFCIPVFVISSVNRSNYLTPIDFESLKESGGIEYTADVIWGLQLQIMNDEAFTKQNNVKEKRELVRKAKAAEARQIELLCLKNRYGVANFSCGLEYYPQFDLFKEGNPQHYEECYTPTAYNLPAPKGIKRI